MQQIVIYLEEVFEVVYFEECCCLVGDMQFESLIDVVLSCGQKEQIDDIEMIELVFVEWLFVDQCLCGDELVWWCVEVMIQMYVCQVVCGYVLYECVVIVNEVLLVFFGEVFFDFGLKC